MTPPGGDTRPGPAFGTTFPLSGRTAGGRLPRNTVRAGRQPPTPMPARLHQRWDDVRSSYWFVPSLMALGAAALGLGLPVLDARLGAEWVERASWLHANRPEGARALLSTVAGSMIGVAGVTFSVTIAAVSYAAGQYGPRLLTNFLRDRGNQVTLGTFVATFLYGLLVLRTVRSADEGAGGAFVPHISLAVSLALALASIGVLIYFIHHASESIHISHVAAEIGQALVEGVDRLFPASLGDPAAGPAAGPPVGADDGDPNGFNEVAGSVLPDGFAVEARAVRASGAGFVEHLDADDLLAVATRHDLVLRLTVRPGDFVREGTTLVLAHPAGRVTPDAAEALQGAFAWGWQRTPRQDTRFLADELVEVAARALSPGVNDPFTAITCLNWLGAALGRMAGRPRPSGLRSDAAGHLRVVTEPASFAAFAEAVFGRLRPYVRADRNAALHTFKILGEISRDATPDERAVLRTHADALLEGCAAALGQEADCAEARERHRALLVILSGRTPWEQAVSETPWLGGSA